MLRLPADLRFRLPLILFVAGAAYVASDSWIDVRIALQKARRTELAGAAVSVERAALGLGDPWFADPEHVRHYLIERLLAQRNVRLTGLLDASGRLLECQPDSLLGADLDSLLERARNPAVERLRQPDGTEILMLRDQRVLATSAPLGGAHAGRRYVQLVDPRARFAELARDIRADAVPGAALGVAIVILVALLLERWLHVPSRRLKTAAERFAAGELGARAAVRGDHEIARAAGAFDRMADEVERTEHELMAARARLDTILHALPVGVAVISRESPRLLYVNPRLRELTGAEPGTDAAFTTLLRRLRIRRIDGAPIAFEEMATARAITTGRPATAPDLVLTGPDGEEVPFVAHALPISLTGERDFDAVVTVIQDRRESLRLSEEVHLWKHRFERVVEATGQAVPE